MISQDEPGWVGGVSVLNSEMYSTSTLIQENGKVCPDLTGTVIALISL